MASLTLVSSSTSQWIFLAQATRTVNLFVVYSECVFVFSGNVALDICFAITVFYSSGIFRYIDDCEKSVDRSQWTFMTKNIEY